MCTAGVPTVDESNDLEFYSQPRLIYHVDDSARMALTEWYRNNLPQVLGMVKPCEKPGYSGIVSTLLNHLQYDQQGPEVSICDLCSSWITHYPSSLKAKRVSAQGMNAEELKVNPQLSDFVVKDLNADPRLPFEDGAFDAVTCALSIDYLTHPREVICEVSRVLKPGGLAAIAFSNRIFFTKATSIWIGTSDLERVWIVGSFFHYSNHFDAPKAYDLHPNAGPFRKKSDPMYVVTAKKKVD